MKSKNKAVWSTRFDKETSKVNPTKTIEKNNNKGNASTILKLYFIYTLFPNITFVSVFLLCIIEINPPKAMKHAPPHIHDTKGL